MNAADLATGVAFVACVALATFIQNLTGFAFSLVLLGLVSVADLVPVADAANAATVLTLVNAASYFRLHRLQPGWQVMRPAMLPSLLGVAAGVALLGWLSGNAVAWLRGLLGLAIMAAAVLLLLQARPRATLSGAAAFRGMGALSGLLGGLFSSAGPPLVFHMYRQPLPAAQIKQCLLLMFAINQLLRLALVVATGQFAGFSAWLSLAAVPVVYGITWLQHRHMPELDAVLARRLVSALLMLAGAALLASVLMGSR